MKAPAKPALRPVYVSDQGKQKLERADAQKLLCLLMAGGITILRAMILVGLCSFVRRSSGNQLMGQRSLVRSIGDLARRLVAAPNVGCMTILTCS